MTDFIVGCDNIVGGESNLIERVCKVLESKGHTAQRLNVGPNYVQSSGLQSSSAGKVAIFIVGGSDIGTYVDFRDGIKNGYYHWKYAWFAFASWTASTWITGEDLKNKPLVRAHDDNFSSSSSIAPYIGKSADYFFQENKQYLNYVYGQTPEELAKKILSGGSDEEGESSATTIKEALRDVLSPLDGEVECKVINDKVYVNKIPEPESSYHLELLEGINIIHDSINITDYNPDTINKLIVHWNNGEDIIYTNEELISRFGEKVSELDAVKLITVTDDSSSETTDSETDSTGTDSDDSKSNTTTKEVPVETYEEASNFAKTEWAKIRRDNGHTIECRVQSSPEWRQGEWVKVYIPSFDENCFMYISKVSQSNSPNNSQCSLSLVDYPPSLGEPKENSESDSEEEEEDTTEEETE